MNSYQSAFPNQVHQLNISISKNHYLLKNDEIKYQSKKFDINWNNYEKTGKRHLVNYLIRDHFSNCFYAEIHPIDEMPDLKDFLYNAWKTKKLFEFRGVPNYLFLSQIILERYPNIKTFSKNVVVFDIELVKNGFASGIRSVRDWENCMKYYLLFNNYNTISDFKNNNEYFCREFNLRMNSKKSESNLEKWAKNKPKGVLIDDKNQFDKYFGN